MRARYNIEANIVGRYGDNSEKAHWILSFVDTDNLKRQMSIHVDNKGNAERCGFSVERTIKSPDRGPMKFVSSQDDASRIFNIIAVNLSIKQSAQIGSAIHQVRDCFDAFFDAAKREDELLQRMIAVFKPRLY